MSSAYVVRCRAEARGRVVPHRGSMRPPEFPREARPGRRACEAALHRARSCEGRFRPRPPGCACRRESGRCSGRLSDGRRRRRDGARMRERGSSPSRRELHREVPGRAATASRAGSGSVRFSAPLRFRDGPLVQVMWRVRHCRVRLATAPLERRGVAAGPLDLSRPALLQQDDELKRILERLVVADHFHFGQCSSIVSIFLHRGIAEGHIAVDWRSLTVSHRMAEPNHIRAPRRPAPRPHLAAKVRRVRSNNRCRLHATGRREAFGRDRVVAARYVPVARVRHAGGVSTRLAAAARAFHESAFFYYATHAAPRRRRARRGLAWTRLRVGTAGRLRGSPCPDARSLRRRAGQIPASARRRR